ncbi:glucokinase [Halioglobus maricola]|uniref:Glucokinase n=1 Tax=Halioglobus maricola TaxID=2601894 RepID=A0A5P9NP83_9GAMM|nr:glucokinase [Halioglobus maricola]QFU77479.1 glucokinase [Halioglobus maricola]
MSNKRLVADVGGTNSRIGIYDADSDTFSAISSYSNRDFTSFEDIVERWLSDLEEERPSQACIAAAAPPTEDRINMINIGWDFSCRDLADRFLFTQCGWLNDFQANSHALPYLASHDLEQIQAGDIQRERLPLAVVGPGTGLGGGSLLWSGDKPVASNAEPGHAGLSPATELELEIFSLLLPRHGNIYTELFVCGAGLARLYGAIAEINGHTPETLSPADISGRALDGSDPLCVTALKTFCAMLGSTCGDFVLSNGAYGGLFIAGGIIPRMIPFLRQSSFLDRFSAKGAMGEYLARVPVQVITTDHPGLIGAAHAPLE